MNSKIRLLPNVVSVLCVLLFSMSSTVLAQERVTLKSVDSRLSRIERVLDQSLLEQLQKVDSLQKEIRKLRGEIESLSYEVDTLIKRNSDLYADTDRRITDMEESQDSLDFFGSEGGLSEGDLGGGFMDETAQPSVGTETAAAPAVFVEKRSNPIPKATAADFGNGPRPPTGELRDTATQAEKAGYSRAYDLLVRGQNDSAVRSFNEFLVSFPDGPYSDNAWYWQGEAMYAQRNFDSALRNFGVVVNSFPKSTKVPDARLKIGFALYEQQKFNEAKDILAGVQNDYPGRSAAVLARKRLQKMARDGQ
jgi:tol-pal system protein YbgF